MSRRSQILEKKKKRTLRAQKFKSPSLPNTPSSRGISVKSPMDHGPEQIQNRLKKKSPWYASIVDPIKGADCKVPDDTGVDTGTLQMVQKFQANVDAGGTCGIRLKTPYPYSGGVATPFDYIVTGTLPGDVDFTDTGSVPEAFTALKAYSDGVRVVSAAIYCQSDAALSSNEGMMVGYVNPFGDSLYPADTTTTELMNSFKAATVPINSGKACVAKWYPIRKNDKNYRSFYNPGADITQMPYYEMGVLVTGAHYSGGVGSTFTFTTVVNYEFTPTSNTLNILGAKSSPQDEMEESLVTLWTQDMEIAGAVNNTTPSRSPESVSPSHEDDESGFGMFFNVITELMPLALALL